MTKLTPVMTKLTPVPAWSLTELSRRIDEIDERVTAVLGGIQEQWGVMTRSAAATLGVRDTFAMNALAGLAANPELLSSTAEALAARAYEIADAALARRTERPPA